MALGVTPLLDAGRWVPVVAVVMVVVAMALFMAVRRWGGGVQRRRKKLFNEWRDLFFKPYLKNSMLSTDFDE
jgi:hypothetical protein